MTLVPPWTYPPSVPAPVDPRVVQDWTLLDVADSQSYGGGTVNPLNASNFDDFTWAQDGTTGRWSIGFTDNADQVDGIRELPQLQWEPSALFTAALENGQSIQVAVKFVSASVPTAYGIGPCIFAGYGAAGAAGVGSLGGFGVTAALEGGIAGNARTIDTLTTLDVVREEFDWPTDYAGVGLIYEFGFRQDAVGNDRTPIISVAAYLADGTCFYRYATTGPASDVDPADFLLGFGFYSRFSTTPTGTYSIVMEQPQYRLLDAEAMP